MARRMKAKALVESMRVGKAVNGLLEMLALRHPLDVQLAVARNGFGLFLDELEDETKAAVATEAVGPHSEATE